jgi:hypothetical protein
MRRPEWLIRGASILVPAERRAEWIKEWLAELHYAQEQAGDARSYAFACGAFHDALWQQRDFWTLKRTRRLAQSPWLCLAVLALAPILIVLASGGAPLTRLALKPLPYRDASRIVLISQAGSMAERSGVPGANIALWRNSAQTLDGIATYQWRPGAGIATISENFFNVLAPERPAAPGFWFLSPNISRWQVGQPDKRARFGVVARLRPGVSPNEASAELSAILRTNGVEDWDTLVELTPLASRVHLVFWVFASCLGLAMLIVLPTLRLRMPTWNPAAAGFFLAKTAVLLVTVLLCGIEFTRASSITMLGGSDGFVAVSAWLFVMGSTGSLAWSIADQRQRCRVCLKRLGMAAHVGCTGCLLLDWAGTELVCVEGHGMLHVPEMVACWQEPDTWTFLDESWQELFERG